MFLHSPEAHIIDLVVVDLIDVVVVVVIRFVAMDFIPAKSIARERGTLKGKSDAPRYVSIF